MDLKEIKELMSLMDEMEMTKLSIKTKDFECELEKTASVVSVVEQGVAQMRATAPLAAPAVTPVAVSPQESSSNHRCITSPVVGTFYVASSPEKPAFVKVGDTVSEDSVVAIVEAMKVMNEVKAGISGKVVEVLINDGQPVEFGTDLFRVE